MSDMGKIGRNPARIIPAMRAFADDHTGRRVRYLGEPAWAGRSRAELLETCRHEALVNLAFAHDEATILCPYDASRLPPPIIANVRRTHPIVISDGEAEPSQEYLGPASFPAGCDGPLPAPPEGARSLYYDKDLRPLRAFVANEAERAGLPADRATDLVLAASELAANTLCHTTDGGTALLWRTGQEILCEVRDTGHIADPLAGRRAPADDHAGGQGLWLVNRVCDLVELRSGAQGTTIRLHMLLP
jgi:anti-sigma regulatory factor (Ser/Thr protein kinase)